MKREIIRTDKAPISRFPISQGTKFGRLIFTAGMTPRDPRTGQMIDGEMRDVARVVFNNIKAIVEAGGSTMKNVLQLTCYLRDFDEDFEAWNDVYKEFFPEEWPARTVIPAPLGKGFRLEVDAVACIPDE
jgi:2-iminobutanoate/2-iminopropanoate deaminase